MPDKHITKVRVTNHASGTIAAVTVGHKYSNVFKNTGTFLNITDGQTATSPEMIAEFNTGWATTGKDWWIVTWIIQRTENGQTFLEECAINPSNFRGVIDFSEGGAKLLVDTLKSIAASVAVATVVSGALPAALPSAAAAATAHVVGMSMNNEETDGYKQHILREEDVANGLEILIANNEKLYFKSQSGQSETTYTRRRL